MKRICSLLLAMMLLFSCLTISFATDDQTLSDIIGKTYETEVVEEYTEIVEDEQTSFKEAAEATQDETGGSSFMAGLQGAGNLTNPDISEDYGITSAIKTVAAYIIKILSYFIITFLAVRIILDITYIVLPFTRTFLANGYSGQAQSSGQGMMNPGMGGMTTIGMNRGGYGMNRGGYGMNSMNQMGSTSMQNQMVGQNAMINRNSSMIGNIQFVSNAALNAAATESAIGPDGKTQSPFKIYFKDMTITLIVTPILIVLAITGVVSDFGFLLADFICQFIERAGTML